MLKIEQLQERDWDEKGVPEELCIIKMNPDQFQFNYLVTPIEYHDYGLGACKSFVFKIGTTKYWTRTHFEYDDHVNFINVAVRSTEKDSQVALNKLLQATKIDAGELNWVNNNIGPARWVLIRLDNNGNEFEMERFLNAETAKGFRDIYEEKGHKQTYVVRHEL